MKKITLGYVYLMPQILPRSATANEDEMRAFYEQHKNNSDNHLRLSLILWQTKDKALADTLSKEFKNLVQILQMSLKGLKLE